MIKALFKIESLEMLLACFFWGFGFIGTSWALESFSPYEIISLRFLICVIPNYLILKFLNINPFDKKTAVKSFLPSLILSITLLLQAIGQQSTTATNAGFITCLYILFVPIIEKLISPKAPKLRYFHFIFIMIGLLGTSFVCKIVEFDFLTQNFIMHTFKLNTGDLFVLGAAIFAALQIVTYGHAAQENLEVLSFSLWQNLFAGLLPLIIVLFFQNANSFSHFSYSLKSILGLLVLSFGSTLFAFYLQLKAQKKISAHSAAIIYQLESPFAAILAFYFLNERLSVLQAIGAIIILISASFAAILSLKESA